MRQGIAALSRDGSFKTCWLRQQPDSRPATSYATRVRLPFASVVVGIDVTRPGKGGFTDELFGHAHRTTWQGGNLILPGMGHHLASVLRTVVVQTDGVTVIHVLRTQDTAGQVGLNWPMAAVSC